jgi:hypothetical protein
VERLPGSPGELADRDGSLISFARQIEEPANFPSAMRACACACASRLDPVPESRPQSIE